ncbi:MULTISPECIES: GGDEF domain-containing protein [Vibrio]|uniref:GGDEF domain-containing protein n=1 Tax=Vibrio genomosp. F6 str. FF-238 TaxID=1191298 RepID=A0A1E5DCD5_9VIBR|nr:GGDEF domain-containing protein [Vibrio genomosp. F6]OEE81419.1 hypothetical protein A130_00070 [Vibrio genomosp. F6 str. FF-238]
MSVEQAYYFSVALINLVFALAGTRVKELESHSHSIQFFMISFLAYFVSWFIYVFEVNIFLEILAAVSASIFVWGMVVFSSRRCGVNLPWVVPVGMFCLQVLAQIYALMVSDLKSYLHVSSVFLPIAFCAISYMFLKLKVKRHPSDIIVGYAFLFMTVVIIGRSILLEVSPDLFARSSLYSQIIWPAFCTTVGVFTLLSYTEEAQIELEKESNTDLLTGLYNRRMFDTKLTNGLDYMAHTSHFGVLIYFDLDGFKPINDQLGHYIGDEVLVELGARLKRSAQRHEVLARLGGDEFALLHTHLGKSEEQAKEKAEKLALKMQKLVNIPIQYEQHTIKVSSSIGVHMIAPGNQSEKDILTKADAAMYQSKAIKKGSITFSGNVVMV